MAQIMDAYVGHTRCSAEAVPDFHDRRVRQLRLFIDKQVRMLVAQLRQNVQRRVIQRHDAATAGLAVSCGDAPYTISRINLTMGRLQGLVEASASAEQPHADEANRSVGVRAQHMQQPF